MTSVAQPIKNVPPAELLESTSHFLADMSDKEFDLALQRMQKTMVRQRAIMDTVLIEGTHYGNPLDRNANPVFKNDILYQAGADHLVETFHCQWGIHEQGDVEEVSAEYVRVTVRRILYDIRGRIMARGEGTCTSHEKRFRPNYGDKSGFTWRDAREVLHDIRAIATKRCRVTTVIEGFGLRGFIGQEEGDDDEKKGGKPLEPWTEAERKNVFKEASAVGMDREDLKALAFKLFGRTNVGTGKEVADIITAIKKWTPADRPKRSAEDPR